MGACHIPVKTKKQGFEVKRKTVHHVLKLFRMLFSDRKNLLSLYNAVNGSSYEDPDALEIVTLENAVYMGMKNDLAFIVDTGLFLYEHQSTYNPNMPLRDLFYIAGEYQKLVDHRSLYSSSIQKIPAPNFLVFYNGTERKEDSWVNYLSESYENLTGEPNLELKVITLNINEGHNSQLLEQCQILREYAQYVAKVREYAGSTDLDTAVEQAVNDCIQNGILAEFLRKKQIGGDRNEYIRIRQRRGRTKTTKGRIRSRKRSRNKSRKRSRIERGGIAKSKRNSYGVE